MDMNPNSRTRSTCCWLWILAGGGLFALLLILLPTVYSSFTGSRPSTKMPKSSSATLITDSTPLLIEGWRVRHPIRTEVTLVFHNQSSFWPIKDLKISKVLLGSMPPTTSTTPVTVKSIQAGKAQTIVLTFPKMNSSHLEIELEYRSGLFGGTTGSSGLSAELVERVP